MYVVPTEIHAQYFGAYLVFSPRILEVLNFHCCFACSDHRLSSRVPIDFSGLEGWGGPGRR